MADNGRLSRLKIVSSKLLSKGRGSHDLEHTGRVADLAVMLARKEGADTGIVLAAALLHDVARHAEDKRRGAVDHALLGGIMAEKVLKRLNYSKPEISRIRHCVETHRFRGAKKPLTIEAKCLFDADKLDSIGAVGIGRAFLFAGEVGAKLHNKGVDIRKTRPYTEDDTAYREYMVKLRHVKKRMLTKEGRRLAEKRSLFMDRFFRQLDLEVSGKA
ncbi:MAG TPA: HD domain-containing protein [Candidatus Goldiibacteriota bacterium]|nr:HD domain-containing protein [Candidatus Goldiibacteriota bacterium]